MPPDDLKIYRDIQRGGGRAEPYQAWIQKMRPQDRLAIANSSQPNLPALEWKLAAPDVWIGRLPGGKAAPAEK